MKQRIFSLFTALCLCFTLLPTAALAEVEGESTSHTHCVCGTTHENIGLHKAADTRTWTAITPSSGDTISLADLNNQITGDGSYYLTADVVTDDTWTLPADKTVALCLNGHSFTANVNGPAISQSSQQFTLSDCKETGKITHGTGYSGYGVRVEAQSTSDNQNYAFHFFGGNIAANGNTGVYLFRGMLRMYGGKITSNTGSGITIDGEGYVALYGGEISNNSAQNGGGIFAKSAESLFIAGGTIKNNTAVALGGGVYANVRVFSMDGGTVTENTATSGGGIYLTGYLDPYTSDEKYSVKLNGGSITDNSATNGGGIYLQTSSSNGQLWLYGYYGDVLISGNTAKQHGGGIYSTGGVLIHLSYYWGDKTTKKITGNRAGTEDADGQGGGVYLDPSTYRDNIGSVNLEKNSQIIDNKSGGKDSNVYLPNSLQMQLSSSASAKVGVTTSVKPTNTTLVKVTPDDHTEQITSDEGYLLFYDGSSTCLKTEDYVALGVTNVPTAKTDLVYDGSEQALVSSDGIVTEDATIQYRLSSDNGRNYSDWSDELPTAKNAGRYIVQVRAAKDGSYSGAYTVSGEIAVIAAKTVTLANVTVADKSYDGTTAATVESYTLTGVLEGDTVTLDGTANFTTKNAGTDKTLELTGLTLGGEDGGNYKLDSASLSNVPSTAAITGKSVTVSGVSAVDRVYDGTTTVALSGGTVDGKADGDEVEVDLSDATGTVENPDASEESKAVTVCDVKLSGKDAGNYFLSEQPTGVTVTIGKADITANDYSASIVYGDTSEHEYAASAFGITQDGSFEPSGSGMIDNGQVLAEGYAQTGDVVRVKLKDGLSLDTPAQTVTIHLTFTPHSSNYNAKDVTLTITLLDKQEPTVTVDPISKTYSGSALTAADIFGETGGVAGTWSWKNGDAPKDVADSTSNSKTWTVVFTPTNTALYKSVEKEVTVTIAPKVLTKDDLEYNGEAITKVYDGTTDCNQIYVTVKAASMCGTDTPLTIAGTATYNSPNVYEATKVTFVSDAQSDNINYAFANGMTLDIPATITSKTVTPVASITDVLTYDGTEKQPTVTVKVGDTTLTENADYTLSYDNNVNAGEKTAKVIVTAKDGGNYTWTEADGTKTFSIAKATISYTAPVVNNTNYNGAAQQLIATAGTATGGTFYYRLGESGEWTTDISTLTATDAGSYTIYYYVEGGNNHQNIGTQAAPAGSIDVSIRRIHLSENCTVTLDQTSYTYDGTAKSPTVTVTYKGKTLTEGTDYTVTGQTSATDVEGTYKLEVVATESGNFTGSKPMWWHIAAAPLTVTGVTAADKSYDGTADAAVSVSFDGLVNGETLTVGTDYTVSGSFSDSNAGTDKPVTATVTLISSEAGYNYTLTGSVPTTTATINQKVVGLDWTNTSLTYNGSAQQPTATATGLVNGDTCTVTVSGAQVNAGENYTATATGLSNSNYTLPTDATMIFTINKADLPESSYPTNLTGYKGRTLSTVELPDGWTWVNGDTELSTEQSTYAANYAGTDNYNAQSNVMLTVNVSNKESKTLTVNMTGWTYGETAKTPSYTKATGAGEAVVSYKSKGAEDFTYRRIVPTNAGEYTVQVSYETATEIWSGTADFTIAKATPTGAPKYTAITSSGKTLADAALAVNESWPDGTVKWVDADGSELDGTTTVAANTAYTWLFTPTDSTNYNTLSGTVTLWRRSSSSGGSSSGSSSSGSTTITVPVSSDHATVEVKAEVSKGNATVEVSDKQIEKVAADGAGEVTIDVSGLKNVESATIPSHVVEKTNEAENTGLTVALPAGSVTLDETALESVTENANGKDVTVSVEVVPTDKLSTAVKKVIGMETTVVAVVDVNVTIGGKKQSSFDGGKITISIPYTPKKGEDTSKLTVWFIRDDGTIENKGGYYDAKNKCFVFETEHLSQYLLVNTNELVRFTDVPADAWYAAAVNWAVKQNITGGVGNSLFAPDASCTRAQNVTFLWRAAGSSEPKTTSSFTDVSANAYYAKAVAWAFENGIVGGYGNGLFGSEDTITREQFVTILYRFAVAMGYDVSVGEDTNILSYNDAFDVSEYAVSAFQWATGAGIVQGADGSLMPKNSCTRAQIVAMLYRLLSK